MISWLSSGSWKSHPSATRPSLQRNKEWNITIKKITSTSVRSRDTWLPKVVGELELGDSRTQALNRARSNERSLIRKNTWPQFQTVIKEYLDLHHAQPVSPEDLLQPPSAYYYMPIHAVHKQSSSTTKLRAVFDASAKSTSQVSLNDMLAVGTTIQPTLDQTLLRFRTYPIAISGDISKMYREVVLSPGDRSLHRFIWREDITQPWKDYQMSRVTFGVAASPYLAVKTLQQASRDFGSSLPKASYHIENSDDFFGGANTPEEAITLQSDIRTILLKAGFQLKKWRSSSSQVLNGIPTDLLEPLPTQDLVDLHSASYPKALGLVWDSREDTMATHVELPVTYVSTKRGVVSDVARTFDVLGWLSPTILPMKLLYRQLWQLQLEWDQEVPDNLKQQHKKWRDELHLLAAVRLPRYYYHNQKKPLTITLHGFCDASQEAYAATIYVRATYSSGPPSSNLVISKTRVAPLKSRTIPQLELCGANLLAKLLTATSHTLAIPLENIYAYCDSTIVLAWLDGSLQRYKIYVANRIANTINLIPPKAWRHVPTLENPADCASRGLTAKELTQHHLWWHGPPWLQQQPVKFPPQPAASRLKLLQDTEAKPQQCNVTVALSADQLETKSSSLITLIKVTCWIKRFIARAHKESVPTDMTLSRAEGAAAEEFLRKRSQARSFKTELHHLKARPPKLLSSKSCLLALHPYLDKRPPTFGRKT